MILNIMMKSREEHISNQFNQSFESDQIRIDSALVEDKLHKEMKKILG